MVTHGSTLHGLSRLSRLSHGEMGSPSSAIADSAVDCGSVGSSTARWSHVVIGLYRGVSGLVTLLWQPSCHGGMGSLFGMCTHKKNKQTYST